MGCWSGLQVSLQHLHRPRAHSVQQLLVDLNAVVAGCILRSKIAASGAAGHGCRGPDGCRGPNACRGLNGRSSARGVGQMATAGQKKCHSVIVMTKSGKPLRCARAANRYDVQERQYAMTCMSGEPLQCSRAANRYNVQERQTATMCKRGDTLCCARAAIRYDV